MRKLIIPLLFVLAGCCECSRYSNRTGDENVITQSGYPVYHRNDFVRRNIIYPERDACHYGCVHVRERVYQQIYESPIYKPIFLGVDERGNRIYERQLITPGYQRQEPAGYRCMLCGVKLK